MENKYVKIEYEGDFPKVESHIREKLPSVQSSDIFQFNGKIYINVSADEHDDLFFFRNYEIDEVTKTKYVSVISR